ncbi:hypothetical protein CLAIMM_11103 [Cladophialophora immunda]|nr:hypothetical protein CLAIMM_11103 [Cladophialophora immunda]
MLHLERCATGLLVSIQARHAPDLIAAVTLGRVHVKPLPREFMNWSALRGLKGPQLPAEMRAGLLRRVWDRRGRADPQPVPLVTPGRILNDMPRPWHRDGAVLNDELDRRFVGARPLGPPSRWKVSGLDAEQIQKSRERAAAFVEN